MKNIGKEEQLENSSVYFAVSHPKVTGSSNFKNTVVCRTAFTICRGLSHPTGWAALASETYHGIFFKGGETL